MTRRTKLTVNDALDEIRVLLHEINQKIEHVIRRLPKHPPNHLHDSNLNNFLD